MGSFPVTDVASDSRDSFRPARKLRRLTPGEFMEMFSASVEQDAWLLDLHGAALGLVVDLAHLVIFGW